MSYLDLSTKLKLKNNVKLKSLSNWIGHDKNMDSVSNYIQELENAGLDHIHSSSKNLKLPTLDHCKAGLYYDLHNFSRLHIIRDCIICRPYSSSNHPNALGNGIHQDNKTNINPTRVTLKHNRWIDYGTVANHHNRETFTFSDKVTLEDEGFFLVMV